MRFGSVNSPRSSTGDWPLSAHTWRASDGRSGRASTPTTVPWARSSTGCCPGRASSRSSGYGPAARARRSLPSRNRAANRGSRTAPAARAMSRDWQELAAPQRRGTPPGSMRYFAVLFAGPGVRQLLHAFYAFEAELRDTIGGASHDIAHTRLQWWHEELTRLGDGRPRHPVTIALAPAMAQRPADLARLRELMHAAALDLARNTYADWPELERYYGQCGALQKAIAGALTSPSDPDEAECRFARRLGAAVRQTEMLRDFGHDLRRGPLYLPMSALTAAGLDPQAVASRPAGPAALALPPARPP